jgi:hypothetical protein
MNVSKELSVQVARIFGQTVQKNPGLLSGDKEQRDKFRGIYLDEVVGQIPSLKNPTNVAAKLAALKTAGYAVPPVPAGIRGRKVSANDKAEANEAIIAEMAKVNLAPVYDKGEIVDWAPCEPAKA